MFSSAGMTLKDDSIIHVFLTSREHEQEPYSRSLPENKTTEKQNSINTASIEESVAPIKTDEKQDKVRPAIEQEAYHFTEKGSINTVVPKASQPRGTEMKAPSQLQPDHKELNESDSSGKSSMGEISLAMPRYLENTPPVYPSIARMRGYEGVVLLAVEIFADGRVGSLKIKKSSGYSVLDRSALEAVRIWKFDAGRKLGKPVNMWVDVPVKFILKGT
jgi:TonB family protein